MALPTLGKPSPPATPSLSATGEPRKDEDPSKLNFGELGDANRRAQIDVSFSIIHFKPSHSLVR